MHGLPGEQLFGATHEPLETGATLLEPVPFSRRIDLRRRGRRGGMLLRPRCSGYKQNDGKCDASHGGLHHFLFCLPCFFFASGLRFVAARAFFGFAIFLGFSLPCGCSRAVIFFRYLLACSSVLILEMSVTGSPGFARDFSTS